MPPKRKSETEDGGPQQATKGGSDASEKERQRSTRYLPDSELTAEQLAKRIKGREAQARMKERKAMAKAKADGGEVTSEASPQGREMGNEARHQEKGSEEGAASETPVAKAASGRTSKGTSTPARKGTTKTVSKGTSKTANKGTPARGKTTTGTPTEGKTTPIAAEPAEQDTSSTARKRRSSMVNASAEPGSSRTSTRIPSSSDSPASLTVPSESSAAAVPTQDKSAQSLKAPKTRLSAAVPDSELTPEQLARRLKNREAYRKQLEEKRKRDVGESREDALHSSTENSSPQKAPKTVESATTKANVDPNADATQADAAATKSTAKANEGAKSTTVTKAKTPSKKSDKAKEVEAKQKQGNNNEVDPSNSSTTPTKRVSKPRKSRTSVGMSKSVPEPDSTGVTKTVPEPESLTTVSDQQVSVQNEEESSPSKETTKKSPLSRKRKSEHISTNETRVIPVVQEDVTGTEDTVSATVKVTQPSKKRKSIANATQEVTTAVETPVKKSLEQSTGSTVNTSHHLAHVPDSELTPQQLAKRLKNRKSNMNKKRKKRELELAKQGLAPTATPVSLTSINPSGTNGPITPTATETPSKSVPGQKPLGSGISNSEQRQKPSKSERKKRARESQEQEDLASVQRRKLNSGLSSLPANGSPMSKSQATKGKVVPKKQSSAEQQQSAVSLQQTSSESDASRGNSNRTFKDSTPSGDSKAEKRHRRKRNKRASQLFSTPNAKTNGIVSDSRSESGQRSTGTMATATQEPVDDGNLSQVELNDDDYDPSEWKGLDPFMSLFYAFGPLGILGSLEGFITPTDLMCSPDSVVASTSMVPSATGAANLSQSFLHQRLSGQEAQARTLPKPASTEAPSQPARLQIEAPEAQFTPNKEKQNGPVPQEQKNGSAGATSNGTQERGLVSSNKTLKASASTPKRRSPVASPNPAATAGSVAPVYSLPTRTGSPGDSDSSSRSDSSDSSDSSESSDSDGDAVPRPSTLDLSAIEKAKMTAAASAENVKMIERDDSSDESSSEDSDEDASDSDSSESFATAEASSAHFRRLSGRRSLGAVAASVFSRSESAGRRTSLPSKLRISHPARSPIKSRDSNAQNQPSTPASPVSQSKISLSQILEQEEAEEAGESEGESDALSRYATDASADDLDADEEREIAQDALDRQRRNEAEKERAARRKSALGGVGTDDMTFEDVEDGDEVMGDSGEISGDIGAETSTGPDDAYETPAEPMPTPAQKSVPSPSQTSKRPITLSSISGEEFSQSPDVSMLAQASLSPEPVKINGTPDESDESAAESSGASDNSEEETQMEVELTNPPEKGVDAGTHNLPSKQRDTSDSEDASSGNEPVNAVEPPSEKEESPDVDDDSSSESDSESDNLPVQNSAQDQLKEIERSNEDDQNEESAQSSGSFSDDEEEEVHSPPRSFLSRGLDKLLPSRWNKPAETTGTAAKANGLSASQPEPTKSIFGSSQTDLSSQTFGSSVFLSPRRNGSVPASSMPSLSQLNQMKKGRQSMSFLFPTASHASLPGSQPLSSTTTIDKNWISNGDNSASESESSETDSEKNEPPVTQRRSTRNRTQLKSYRAKW